GRAGLTIWADGLRLMGSRRVMGGMRGRLAKWGVKIKTSTAAITIAGAKRNVERVTPRADSNHGCALSLGIWDLRFLRITGLSFTPSSESARHRKASRIPR